MSIGKTGLFLVVIVLSWTACRTPDSWDTPARCGSVTFWSFDLEDTITLSMSSSFDYEGRLVVIDVPAKDTTVVPNDLTKATFNKFCIKDIQTDDAVIILQLWDTVHQQYDVCRSWTGNDLIELYKNLQQ